MEFQGAHRRRSPQVGSTDHKCPSLYAHRVTNIGSLAKAAKRLRKRMREHVSDDARDEDQVEVALAAALAGDGDKVKRALSNPLPHHATAQVQVSY